MKYLLLCLSLLFPSITTWATTYYSTQNGDWSSPSSWSLSETDPTPAGPPIATDDVVIRHEITHIAWNGYTHFGDVHITLDGIYDVYTGSGVTEPYYFAGNLFEVFGILRTSSDFEHQLRPGTGGTGAENGRLVLHQQAILEIGDDLKICSNGQMIINNGICGKIQTGDDLYIIGPFATICGVGRFVFGDIVRVWANTDHTGEYAHNSSSWLTQLQYQVCNGFPLYNGIKNCQDNNPDVIGQGSFPIELTSFAALPKKDKIDFRWETAIEVNNEFFTLERSTDGENFTQILTVAGAGSSEKALVYTASDINPVIGKAVYRLKQTDYNGEFSYSEKVEISFQPGQLILNVFPNPTTDRTIFLEGANPDLVHDLTLMDMTGRILKTDTFKPIAGQASPIYLPAHLLNGVYILTIATEEQSYSKKVILK